jgi:hypothetical protein
MKLKAQHAVPVGLAVVVTPAGTLGSLAAGG